MDTNCNRTIAEADAIAEKAKLEVSTLLPHVQTLYFAPDCNSAPAHTTLVEVDPHILQQLTDGGSLTIRGEGGDSAVLCTDSRTYEVREAETSNSLLLVPRLSWPAEISAEQERHVTDRQVSGTFFTYLELRECRPRLRRLRQLLSAAPYSGRLQPGTGCTAAQLADAVQASCEQLQAALRQYRAVLIDGQYHILDAEYEFSVFSLISQFVDENSWTWETVRRELTLVTLSELEPREVVEAVFQWYLQPTDHTDPQTGEPLFTLREDPVARLFAELLLRPVKTFTLTDFMTSWQQSVPEGVTIQPEQLRGIAVIDNDATPQVVVRLSEMDLPEETVPRFAALFDVKPLWTPQELEPYVEDLTSPSLKLGSLLARHTRMSTKNGVKMHGAKHAR